MAVQISRADIVSEDILDLQSETRFLKLPATDYLDLLGVTPLPSQKAIINAINNPKYRFVCAAVSRRQDNPNTCLLYTSPSPRDGLLSRMPSSA